MKIVNVMAVSLDGKIASHPRESDQQRRVYGFTNQDDQDHVRRELMSADAVITGAESMRASGSTWRVRNDQGTFPIWVVMTRRGLEPTLPFWQQTDIERWLVSPTPLPAVQQAGGVRHFSYGEAEPATFVANHLRQAGAKKVLLFGGGAINRLFYAADLVDELKITICPMIIGQEGAPSFVDAGLPDPKTLFLESSMAIASHVFLHYHLKQS